MAKSLGGIYVNLGLSSKEFISGLASAQKSLRTFSNNTGKIGKELAKSLAIPTSAITAGVSFFGKQYNEAFSKLKRKTGETGESLKSLEKIFYELSATGDDTFTEVSQALGSLQSKTQLAGEPLKNLTTTMLDLADTSDLELSQAIEVSTNFLKSFGITAAEQIPTLNLLFKASQESGIGFDTLATLSAKFGVTLRTLGLDANNSAILISNLGKSGADVEKTLLALKIASQNFSKAGIDPKIGFENLITGLKNSNSETQKSIALNSTNSKVYTTLIDAVNKGGFELDNFSNKIKNSNNAISESAAQTQTWGQLLNQILNPVKTLLGAIGEEIFKKVAPALNQLSQILGSVAIYLLENHKNILIWTAGIIAALSALTPFLFAIKLGVLAIAAWATPLGIVIASLISMSAVLGTVAVAAIKYQNEIFRLFDGLLAKVGAAGVYFKQFASDISIGNVENIFDRAQQSADNYEKTQQRLADKTYQANLQIEEQKTEIQKTDNSLASFTNSLNLNNISSDIQNKLLNLKNTDLKKQQEELKKTTEQWTNYKRQVSDDNAEKTMIDNIRSINSELNKIEFDKALNKYEKFLAGKKQSELQERFKDIPESEIRKQAKKEADIATDELAKEFEGDPKVNYAMENLGADLTNILANSLQQGLTTLFDGGSLRGQMSDLGSQLGSQAGQAIGTAIAGPLGGAVGSAIGNKIGEKAGEKISKLGVDTESTIESLKDLLPVLAGIDAVTLGGVVDLKSVFGVGNKDKQIRKAFKNGILNLFEDANIDFNEVLGRGFEVPKGAFQSVSDRMKSEIPNLSEVVDAKNLDKNLENTFDGLGKTFAQIFELDPKLASQFGDILAFNFQDSEGLNELQLAMTQAGLSAEDIGKKLEDSFIKGNLSAKEFLTSLNSSRELMQAGIPAAIGAVDIAFKNLTSKGLQDGLHAMDSLKDLAVEAGEAGATSIDALRNKLIASGQSSEEVNKLMQSLQAAGVTTLDQLKNLSAEDTAKVVSNLEDLGFGFKKVNEDIFAATKNLENFIGKANAEVVTNWVINVKQKGDTIPTDLNTQITAAATGGIFKDIEKFAKGGIVNTATYFNHSNGMGLMGEAGAEAIMPVTRVGGVLGVRAAVPKNSGKSVNINIDARGAANGVEDDIRIMLSELEDNIMSRTIETVIDMSNRGQI